MIEANSSPRFLRGVAIARTGAVRQLRADLWSVPSQSRPGAHHLVDIGGEQPSCSCEDFQSNGLAVEFACAHGWAARVAAKVVEAPDEDMEVETSKRTYPQNWPAYEKAQQHEREHFVTLLRDLCTLHRRPCYVRLTMSP